MQYFLTGLKREVNKHVVGLVVGLLLYINLYSLFSMFNFSGKSRGRSKQVNEKK